MPLKILNLQMYADGEAAVADMSAGDAATDTAETPSLDEGGEQVASAPDGQPAEESWDSLIKGRYKKEYNAAVKSAVDKRFKNQRNLQSQISAIDPLIQHLAKKYQIFPDANGQIPIDRLSDAVMYDSDAMEQEAYQRGMSVDTLKEIKKLEAENQRLQGMREQTRQQQEWQQIQTEANDLREFYPDFDINEEMMNEEFGSLLATLRRSGFPNAVRKAYEVVHHDEIMEGTLQYATRQAREKTSRAIQSGLNRPKESAAGAGAAAGVRGIDITKLSDEQIDDYIRRANAGERITFR